MRIDETHPEATLWRHPRSALLALLALIAAATATPTLLAIDAPLAIAWSNTCTLLLVIAAAWRCFATTRRLRGEERTAWLFVSFAFLSYALAQAIWSGSELILNRPNPVPSLADIGYLAAPPLMVIGIWLYRTSAPTRAAMIVQLGNAGILIATIFIANMILLEPLLTKTDTPGLSALLIVYVVIAMTAFVFALFNVCFYMRGRRRLVMMPLLFGLGSLATADYISVYEFASSSYHSASFGNLGYFFLPIFGYWAAFEQDQLRRAGDRKRDLLLFEESARQWGMFLLPLALTGLIAVALTHPENLTAALLPYATGALVLVIVSAVARDWWSLRIQNELRDATRTSAESLRESEQELRTKNEELAKANRELSSEMTARRRVEEELRHAQKMEAIGQLTGGVAHDFNNLLAVIVGNIDLLEQTFELDGSQLTYTQEAIAAAHRGAALTERLLAFSRKQALDPKPTRVSELFESMKGLLERTLGETIQLRFDVSEDTAPCMVDRVQLENAILNLVLNARDAMRGGGVITIEASNVGLDPQAAEGKAPNIAAGGCVRIAVRDTGVGMSARVRARAFEPFFTTKEIGAGSGLGLSMVYGFARQSGGHVEIESEPESGTEVRLFIPQTRLSPTPITRADVGATPSGRRESLLVVEDDDALRTVIVAFLEKQNYRVAAARDAAQALALLDAQGPFDLLLSDVILPGAFTGPELAREIESRQPSIAVLLMSGYASDALEGKASPPNFANLLQKPFNMGMLARAIRSILRAKKRAAAKSHHASPA